MAENRTMKEKPALCIQGMARKFVRESIIEDAATRLITQIMTEVADAHIAPRDAEITSLRAQLDEARAAFTQIREHTKDVVDDDLIAVVDMIAEDFLDPSKRAPLRALLSESKT